jgi:transposase-like protein
MNKEVKGDTYRKISYCPFCGSDKIKYVYSVPRCMSCRSVFFNPLFSRFVRKSPKSK